MTIVLCALYLRVSGQDRIRMDDTLVNVSHSSRLATGVRVIVRDCVEERHTSLGVDHFYVISVVCY